MKKLLLLFGLLILLIFSSEAQQYGKYPYKFDFYGPMQWNQTNDSIHISVLGCLFEPLHMIFSKSSDFEVLRRQSFSNNLWQPYQIYPATNTIQLDNNFFFNDDLCIVANKKDTVAIIDMRGTKPTMPIRELTIKASESNNNIFIRKNVIAICDVSDNYQVNLFPNFGGGICENDDYGPFRPIFYHNDKQVPNFIFTAGNLKSGDSLTIEVFGPGVETCGMCYSTYNSNIRRVKYYIQKGVSAIFSLSGNPTTICPGDTVTIKAPVGTTEALWTKKRYPNSYFYTAQDTTKLVHKSIFPTEIQAHFFIRGRGHCPVKSDTLKIKSGLNCPYGIIIGKAFNDLNGDKKNEYPEKVLTDQLYLVQPGSMIVPSYDQYYFRALVPNGKKIKVSVLSDGNTFSDTIEVDFTNTNNFNYKEFIEIPAGINIQNDLQVEITGNRMRPGFAATYNVDLRNNGNAEKLYTLELVVDTMLHNVQINPTPTSSLKNKYNWKNYSLYGFSSSHIKVSGTILPDVKLLGKEVITTAQISSLADPVMSNNYDTSRVIIRGSYDPNDKQAFSDNGSKAEYIGENKILEYMIRFQNKGTDTAFTVVVKDSIKAGLDISGFKMLSASHRYKLDIVNNSILVWTFSDILLPDDKVNEPGSHGYIKFKIKQKKGNVLGSRISNDAYIYFDYNPAIVTNKEVVTVGEFLKVTSLPATTDEVAIEVFPNPSQGNVTVYSTLNGTLQIFNQQGILMETEKFFGNSIIETEKYAAGIYLVKIKTDQSVITRKFTVVK